MFTIRSKFCQIALFSAVFLLCSSLSLTAFAVPRPEFEKNSVDDSEQVPSPDDFIPIEIFPEMIFAQTPLYPEKDREAGHEGEVWVVLLVDKSGHSAQSTLGRTSGYESLDNSALEVATKTRFKPAIRYGRPTSVWVTYKVTFKLTEAVEVNSDASMKTLTSRPNLETGPKLISSSEPIYPQVAKDAGVEGSVIVRAMVDRDGLVHNVRIEDREYNPHEMTIKISVNDLYGFKASAKEAALKYRFEPATRSGKVIEACVEFEVDFKIE